MKRTNKGKNLTRFFHLTQEFIIIWIELYFKTVWTKDVAMPLGPIRMSDECYKR